MKSKVDLFEGGKEVIRLEEEPIAQGGTSIVFLGRRTDGSGVAVKVLKYRPKNCLSLGVQFLPPCGQVPTDIHTIKKEIELMKRFAGPFVIKVLGRSILQWKVWMVTELCPVPISYAVPSFVGTGRLRQFNVKEDYILHLMVPIIHAVAEMHRQGYIHRDIKVENIMLSKDGIPKLNDFGLAVKMDSEEHLATNGMFCGTPYYIDPYGVRGEGYDEYSDVFSMGVTILKLKRNMDFDFMFDMFWGDIKDVYVRNDAEVLTRLKNALDSAIDWDHGPEVNKWASIEKNIKRLFAFEKANRISFDFFLEEPVCTEILNDWKNYFAGKETTEVFKIYREVCQSNMLIYASLEFKKEVEGTKPMRDFAALGYPGEL